MSDFGDLDDLEFGDLVAGPSEITLLREEVKSRDAKILQLERDLEEAKIKLDRFDKLERYHKAVSPVINSLQKVIWEAKSSPNMGLKECLEVVLQWLEEKGSATNSAEVTKLEEQLLRRNTRFANLEAELLGSDVCIVLTLVLALTVVRRSLVDLTATGGELESALEEMNLKQFYEEALPKAISNIKNIAGAPDILVEVTSVLSRVEKVDAFLIATHTIPFSTVLEAFRGMFMQRRIWTARQREMFRASRPLGMSDEEALFFDRNTSAFIAATIDTSPEFNGQTEVDLSLDISKYTHIKDPQPPLLQANPQTQQPPKQSPSGSRNERAHNL